jgi:hypothetical protein
VKAEQARIAEVKISVSASIPNPGLDRFLYAPIGDEVNGTVLTVLSALARRNVDPWEAATDLDRLPRSLAIDQLAGVIAALPNRPLPLAEPTATAERLVALLPQHREPSTSIAHAATQRDGSPRATARDDSQAATPLASRLLMVGVYIAMMLVLQLFLARVMTEDKGGAHPADAAAAEQAPSPDR